MQQLSIVWRGFVREERWALISCAVLVIFCTGMQSSRSSTAVSPIFVDASVDAAQVSGEQGHLSDARRLLRVHVSGAVRRPGVQILPARARVIDAIKLAGGSTGKADTQIINLAAHLQDGQHIRVPFKGQYRGQELPPVVVRSQGPDLQPDQEQASPAKAVNVNTATAAELEALPGAGPAIAERIVRYREEKGRFQSLQDLDAVKGLGPKKLEKVRPYVVF